MFGNLVAALKAYRPQIHRLQLRGSDLDVGGADQAVDGGIDPIATSRMLWVSTRRIE